jgi:hypothetical protein
MITCFVGQCVGADAYSAGFFWQTDDANLDLCVTDSIGTCSAEGKHNWCPVGRKKRWCQETSTWKGWAVPLNGISRQLFLFFFFCKKPSAPAALIRTCRQSLSDGIYIWVLSGLPPRGHTDALLRCNMTPQLNIVGLNVGGLFTSIHLHFLFL